MSTPPADAHPGAAPRAAAAAALGRSPGARRPLRIETEPLVRRVDDTGPISVRAILPPKAQSSSSSGGAARRRGTRRRRAAEAVGLEAGGGQRAVRQPHPVVEQVDACGQRAVAVCSTAATNGCMRVSGVPLSRNGISRVTEGLTIGTQPAVPARVPPARRRVGAGGRELVERHGDLPLQARGQARARRDALAASEKRNGLAAGSSPGSAARARSPARTSAGRAPRRRGSRRPPGPRPRAGSRSARSRVGVGATMTTSSACGDDVRSIRIGRAASPRISAATPAGRRALRAERELERLEVVAAIDEVGSARCGHGARRGRASARAAAPRAARATCPRPARRG